MSLWQNKEEVIEVPKIMSYLIGESGAGPTSYHLCREQSPEKALCGAEVLPSAMSVAEFGATFGKSSMPRIWCPECAKLAGLEPAYPGEEF